MNIYLRKICLVAINLIIVFNGYTFDINKNSVLDIMLILGTVYNERGYISNKKYLSTYGKDIVKIIEADLKFKYKVKGIGSTCFELEADNNRAGVIRIRQAWFNLRAGKYFDIRLGNMRKKFGLQESRGSLKRMTIEKNLLYRYIRSFGVLDYDLLLRTKVEHDIKNNRNKYFLALGGDDNMRIFFNFSYWLSFKNGKFGLSEVYVNHIDTRKETTNSNHLVTSFEYNIKNWNTLAEFFTGIDPYASELYRLMLRYRKVKYLGLRFQVSSEFRIPKSKERIIKALEPVIEISWLSDDIDTISSGYMELLSGFNIIGKKKFPLRWMTDFGTIFARKKSLSDTWSVHCYKIASQLQIQW